MAHIGPTHLCWVVYSDTSAAVTHDLVEGFNDGNGLALGEQALCHSKAVPVALAGLSTHLWGVVEGDLQGPTGVLQPSSGKQNTLSMQSDLLAVSCSAMPRLAQPLVGPILSKSLPTQCKGHQSQPGCQPGPALHLLQVGCFCMIMVMIMTSSCYAELHLQ